MRPTGILVTIQLAPSLPIQYDHWKGLFYPEDLPRQRWFEHYAGEFDTVEINTSFYHLPAASTFEAWRNQAPAGFGYALKFSRDGTHIKPSTTTRRACGAQCHSPRASLGLSETLQLR